MAADPSAYPVRSADCMASRRRRANWDWVARALRKDYHVIAPDLRGHGDSQWITGGTYATADYVYDIAQLIHQLDLAPLRIVAHSMGGSISLRYTGLYPEKVSSLVAIEGLGPSPKMLAEFRKVEIDEGLRGWISQLRKLSGRQLRRYPTVDEAVGRMKEANPHLSVEQVCLGNCDTPPQSSRQPFFCRRALLS